MQQLLAAELLAATSNEGVSLDELVLQLRECMTEKGLPAILRLILDGTPVTQKGTSGNYSPDEIRCRPTLRVGETLDKFAASQKRPSAPERARG